MKKHEFATHPIMYTYLIFGELKPPGFYCVSVKRWVTLFLSRLHSETDDEAADITTVTATVRVLSNKWERFNFDKTPL